MSEATIPTQEFEGRSVTIERANPTDAEEICDIRDRAWLEAYPNSEYGITDDDVKLMAQGTGVGGKLIHHALGLFGRDRDIFLEVVSYNQNAIDFYERFGFEKTDVVVPPEVGRPDYLKSIPQTQMVLRAEI